MIFVFLLNNQTSVQEKRSLGCDRPGQYVFIMQDGGDVQLHLKFRQHCKHMLIKTAVLTKHRS